MLFHDAEQLEALHEDAAERHMEVVEKLATAGADVNARNSMDMTPSSLTPRRATALTVGKDFSSSKNGSRSISNFHSLRHS